MSEPAWVVCPDCEGTGQIWDGRTPDGDHIVVVCDMCQGEGGWSD
jgi:DnaJ-class molecular chaperone